MSGGMKLCINGAGRSPYGDVKLISKRGICEDELHFTVAAPGVVTVGDEIEFYYGGAGIFRGRVFRVTREAGAYGYDGKFHCVACDLLRYFKNKDTFSYKSSSASEVLDMILSVYRFPRGEIADTVYRIARRIDDETTLAGIMENALTLTADAGFGDYILRDDFGSISLLPAKRLYYPDTISPSVCGEFTLTESIDGNYFNKVKLRDTAGGERRFYIAQNDADIARYGLLQYYGAVMPDEFGDFIAGDIISRYGKPHYRLECELYHAKSSLYGDVTAKVLTAREQTAEMICERCEHSYGEAGHTARAVFVSI